MAGPGWQTTSCAELLERLERAGVPVLPAGSATDALLLEADGLQDLLPLRFELRIEETPTVTFARRSDGAPLSYPLDERVARALDTRFATLPIEVPELLLARGAPPGGAAAAGLEQAAQALESLQRSDLELRRLRVLREALLKADLASSDSTLAAVLDALLDLTGADRGALFLVEEGVPVARVHRDRSGSAEPPPLPRRVLERALERASVFTSDDVMEDPALYQDTVERLQIRSLLVAPWVRDGKVRALCYLDRRFVPAVFPPDAVSLFAGLAGDLWRLLEAALDREELTRRCLSLEAEAPLGEFRTVSPGLGRELSRLRQAARTREPILLLGEGGTGKTLLAQGIHSVSRQAAGPYVVARLPEMPESLFESELFGHERGAFTGAVSARPGLLERADGGTLFLDEVGRVPAGIQAKLLGVLDGETASFRRVGGGERRARFRLIAATSVDLEAEVRAGSFLADLWWRLSAGLVVRVPPLRERLEDVPLLARHLLQQLALLEETDPLSLTGEAFRSLERHTWPGNVRELRAVLQRAYWSARRDGLPDLSVSPEDLGLVAPQRPAPFLDRYNQALHAAGYPFAPGAGLEEELQFLRSERIRTTLAECGMNQAKAARRLGYKSPSTLRSQLERLGIEVAKRTVVRTKRRKP